MKQEWTDIQKTYFSLCILLKAAGYSKGCDSFFIVHTDDYVYDEDPNHPESYKKNDISVYNHYYKNSEETLHHFESPMLEEINNWLLEEKGFYVCIRITNNRYFDYDIYKKVENLTFTKYNLVTTTMTHYTSPDEAYIDAFTILLNYLCGMLRYWECVETSTLDQGLCVGALCKSEEEPHIGYERVIWKEISKEEYHKKLNIGELEK